MSATTIPSDIVGTVEPDGRRVWRLREYAVIIATPLDDAATAWTVNTIGLNYKSATVVVEDAQLELFAAVFTDLVIEAMAA